MFHKTLFLPETYTFVYGQEEMDTPNRSNRLPDPVEGEAQMAIKL